jgi:hypothetical protein
VPTTVGFDERLDDRQTHALRRKLLNDVAGLDVP